MIAEGIQCTSSVAFSAYENGLVDTYTYFRNDRNADPKWWVHQADHVAKLLPEEVQMQQMQMLNNTEFEEKKLVCWVHLPPSVGNVAYLAVYGANPQVRSAFLKLFQAARKACLANPPKAPTTFLFYLFEPMAEDCNGEPAYPNNVRKRCSCEVL